MLTAEIVAKFDDVLSRGLCAGLGSPNGQMCVEAAICYALGLPHGDEPECVEPAVKSYKIRLNDAHWSSPQARAAGLRDLGIAQIGSEGVVDGAEFSRRMSTKTIQILIPALFREVLKHDEKCLTAADKCETDATATAAAAAGAAASYSAYFSYSYSAASYSAAGDASYSAYSAATAATTAYSYSADADSAAYSADVYSYSAACAAAAADCAAAAAAAAADYAYLTALAADCAADACADSYSADKYLLLSAKLALETLRELNSPGCKWLELEKR